MKFLPGEARHCALDLCESVHQHSGWRQPLDVGKCKPATGGSVSTILKSADKLIGYERKIL